MCNGLDAHPSDREAKMSNGLIAGSRKTKLGQLVKQGRVTADSRDKSDSRREMVVYSMDRQGREEADDVDSGGGRGGADDPMSQDDTAVERRLRGCSRVSSNSGWPG